MVQSATTTEEPPPAVFPIPSIVIITLIFLPIWLGMEFNYGLFLKDIELSVLIARISSNRAIVGLSTAISLIICGYWFIYKFALRGTNDTNAIVYLVITVCLSISTASFFTNHTIMSLINLNAMFENTVGIWYASYIYKDSLRELIEYTDTIQGGEIHESVRNELSTILLSRYDITNISSILSMAQENKISVTISDTVTAIVDSTILQNLVTLKYVVGCSCWLFFAAMLSIFWAISMFDGINS